MAVIVGAVGGGTWDAATGTAWVGGVAPTAADDVTLTVASGGTFTIAAGAVCRSLNCTGFTGTLANSTATLTIGDTTAGLGNVALTLVSGMTYSNTSGTISFVSTSKALQTIDCAGKSMGNLTVNGASSEYVLTSATTSTGTVTLTAGNLRTDGTSNSSGFTHTWANFSSSNSNVRSLTLGFSSIVLSGTGTVWSFATSTNLTFSGASAPISITDVSASGKIFAGGGQTYNNLSITGGGSGSITISGNNTFKNLPQIVGGSTKTLVFNISSTQTFTGNDYTNFGNGSSLLTLQSSSGGTAFTLVKNVGRVECDYLSLKDSTATGTFYAGLNSVNVSGNTGWIFSSFNPFESHDKTFWLDGMGGAFADRISKTAYTPTSVTKGALIHDGTEMIFNGSTSKIVCGNVGDFYSFTCWLKPSADADNYIDFNGTATLTSTAAALVKTGWTSPTTYVNGVATSSITKNVWSHVAITTTNPITASALVIGFISPSFGTFSITNIKLWDRVLSATEIGSMQYGWSRYV